MLLKTLARLVNWQRYAAAQWLLLGLLCASLFVFLELWEEIAEGEVQSFDETLLLWFRTPGVPDDPIGPPWLEESARDITALGSHIVVMLLTVIVTGLLLLLKRGRLAALAVLAVSSGALLTHFLKQGFDRPRPDLVPHLTDIMTLSFPSGHSLFAALTYISLAMLGMLAIPHRGTRIYLLCMALLASLLVGISRIYLGVHWPSDVIGGLLLGLAWAMVWLFIALRLTIH